MDAQTLEALKASIRHWRDNVAAEKSDNVRIEAEACALCDRFFRWDSCTGCPVSRKTGISRCRQTPYGAASNALEFWDDHPDDTAARNAWRAAAQAELDFLISLLPEGETAE